MQKVYDLAFSVSRAQNPFQEESYRDYKKGMGNKGEREGFSKCSHITRANRQFSLFSLALILQVYPRSLESWV